MRQTCKLFSEIEYRGSPPLEKQINEYLEQNSKLKVMSLSYCTYFVSLSLIREALVIFDEDDSITHQIPRTWDDYDNIGE